MPYIITSPPSRAATIFPAATATTDLVDNLLAILGVLDRVFLLVGVFDCRRVNAHVVGAGAVADPGLPVGDEILPPLLAAIAVKDKHVGLLDDVERAAG